MKFWNPKPEIQNINGISVVRDDLLPGGTKQRGLIPFLQNHPSQSFVYASPAYGYAQVALAVSASIANKKAVIFTAKRKKAHPLTLKAKEYGAIIIQVEYGYLNVVQKRAKDYANETGSFYFPFGVDTPEIRQEIISSAELLSIDPDEVWTVSGSGTLTRALQVAWPKADFNTVIIGKKNIDVGKAKKHISDELFKNQAIDPPPFPSCGNYDAKAWKFIKKYSKNNNVVFWNVAS